MAIDVSKMTMFVVTRTEAIEVSKMTLATIVATPGVEVSKMTLGVITQPVVAFTRRRPVIVN